VRLVAPAPIWPGSIILIGLFLAVLIPPEPVQVTQPAHSGTVTAA
jgi:hypothetical protein